MFSILTTLVFCSSQVMAAPCIGGCHETNQTHKAKAQSSENANHDCCDESPEKETESPCHSDRTACFSQCTNDSKLEVQDFTFQNESGKKLSDGDLAATGTFNQFHQDKNQTQLVAWTDLHHRTSGVPFYIFYQKLLIP